MFLSRFLPRAIALTLLVAVGIGFNLPSDAQPNTFARPSADATWQWQLEGKINTRYEVDVYDIDLFDTPDSTLQQLRQDGRIIICYFSAGSWEDWRADADQFPAETLGNELDGWPDERWLDIRHDHVRAIMQQRLDWAVSRGCDGVEPDNVDAFDNNSGLPLSADDQLNYNRWLAHQAHQRGLMIGLKNDTTQIAELVDHFDFAVSEQCAEYEECESYLPFIAAGKPVFNAEYHRRYIRNLNARKQLCAQSRELGIQTLVLPLALDDSFRYACD